MLRDDFKKYGFVQFRSLRSDVILIHEEKELFVGSRLYTRILEGDEYIIAKYSSKGNISKNIQDVYYDYYTRSIDSGLLYSGPLSEVSRYFKILKAKRIIKKYADR